MFIVKLRNLISGVNILEFKSARKNWDFPKSNNFCESLELRNFWKGIQIQGSKIFRITKMLVFAMVILFLTFLVSRIKYSTH